MRYTTQAVDFYDKLSELHRDLADWSDKTFGPPEKRGPVGCLKHLQKEAEEAVVAAQNEDDPAFLEELADCLLLLLDATRRGGRKIGHVVDAARDKMAVNRRREWPAPTDDDEPVEHV